MIPGAARGRSHAPPKAAERDDSGFSLIEVIVATVVAVIAIMGLAHSFGVGRGLIERFASARDGVAIAQRRMETLSMQAQKDVSHADLSAPAGGSLVHGPFAVLLNGRFPATEEWRVDWVDDPIDGMGASDDDGGDDYKRITVTVRWNQFGVTDKVELVTNVYPQ